MLVAFGVLVAWLNLRGSWTGARDINGVAANLGRVAGAAVHPRDVRWEQSDGALSDWLWGRRVIFRGSELKEPNLGDIYRGRVRLAPNGVPLFVLGVYNLTSTPLGDDFALVTSGYRAAFATRAMGQVGNVTVLDLAGEGAQNTAASVVDKVTTSITNWQRTGSFAGVARVDVGFEGVSTDAGLEWSPGGLRVAVGGGAFERHYELAAADIDAGAARLAGVHLQPSAHVPKRLSHWAVDTVRAVPWIGPEPIAWLEDKAFGARDTIRRTFARKGGELASGEALKAPLLDASAASVEAAHWPPANVEPIWKVPELGEGVWEVPSQMAWLHKNPHYAMAPSPFYKTFVRPDEQRAYAKVLLVAMDMRQLDLAMEAGTEDPQPLTGPHGPGKISRDPKVYSRVLAAFNGAFKSEHGHYGMMVNKRVLLPPQPGAATVVTTVDHRVGLGSWGTDKTFGTPDGAQASPVHAIEARDFLSMRQNLEALLDGGEINPTKRTLWGFPAPGKGVQTERSGLCVTASGHLIYAWGDDVSADTLGKAQKMAGCSFGMHLDMNPYHTGFLFAAIEDFTGKRYRSELLSPGMEIPKDRYLEWAPKDFFYVMWHEHTELPSLEGGQTWQPDAGVQPPPAWAPSFLKTSVSSADGPVDVLAIAEGRVEWRLLRGTNEPGRENKEAETLDEADGKRAVLSLGLGVTSPKLPYLLLPSRGNAGFLRQTNAPQGVGVLALDVGNALAIETSDARSEATGGCAHTKLLFKDEHTFAGVEAQAAMCLAPKAKSYFVLHGSPRAMTTVARSLGCTAAAALDRGAQLSSRIARARAGTGIHARYEDSSLVALALPMKPRAFRFDPTHPVVPQARKR
jgi:hypothetical protein